MYRIYNIIKIKIYLLKNFYLNKIKKIRKMYGIKMIIQMTLKVIFFVLLIICIYI